MTFDQLHRLGKRELICLLLFTCIYVVYVWRGFLFLWVLGMGYVILLWHSLSLSYNYLVYKFKRIIGSPDFSDQFQKIIIRHQCIGYDLNVMRQSVCLVTYAVDNFAALFNFTPVDRAPDFIMAPT